METLQSILTVIFVINCIFLILIILLQSSRSSGMNLFGGGSQTPFGASSADVLTKITGVMTSLFLVLGLVIAYLETRGSSQIEELQQEFNQTQSQEKLTEPKNSSTENDAGKGASNPNDKDLSPPAGGKSVSPNQEEKSLKGSQKKTPDSSPAP